MARSRPTTASAARVGVAWALLLTGSAASDGPARAAPADIVPDPQIAAQISRQFEAPLLRQKTVLPKPHGAEANPHPVVRCFSYPGFAVKEIDSGEAGDDSISVVPLPPGQVLATCAETRLPDERLLKESGGLGFLGARDRFLMLYTADPTGVFPFFVDDAHTGQVLYKDASYDGQEPTGFTVAAGVLTLGFKRGVSGSCSVLAGSQACWARIGEEAHLPRAIMALPAPVEACRASYARQGKTQSTQTNDPSMIGYDVTLTVDRSGATHVLSRGAPDCQPSP